MTEERKPWQRKEGETDKQFLAFVTYRDAGPDKRSIAQVARDLGLANGKRLEIWSSENEWVKRSQAYDDALDNARVDARIEAIEQMHRDHAELATRVLKLAKMSVDRRIEEMEARPFDRVTDGNIGHLMTQAATMERLARGEPTDITGTTDKPRSWAEWIASKRTERGLSNEKPSPFEEVGANGSGNGNGAKPKD